MGRPLLKRCKRNHLLAKTRGKDGRCDACKLIRAAEYRQRRIRCSTCRLLKVPAEFSKNSRTKTGFQNACKSCMQNYSAGRVVNDHVRNMRRRNFFGLTEQDVEQILRQQNGCCAICRTNDPGGRYGTWCVDHDRACCPTSKSCGNCVRGLLCHHCNWGLGQFSDNPQSLRRAAHYLEESPMQINKKLRAVS